jgi:hypothetical protein
MAFLLLISLGSGYILHYLKLLENMHKLKVVNKNKTVLSLLGTTATLCKSY